MSIRNAGELGVTLSSSTEHELYAQELFERA